MQFSSILEAIKFRAETAPTRLAVADSAGNELTYGEYWQNICSAAYALEGVGVKRGDRIVARTVQSVKYLVMLHAVQLLGAVFVPLEKGVSAGRINEIIDRANASFFTAEKPLSEKDGVVNAPFINYFTLEVSENKASFTLPMQDDTAMILFTTGTTGRSKGIVLSYASEVAVAENVVFGVEMKPDNVEVMPMPLNHSMTLRRYYANMLNGSAAVFLDGVVFIRVLFNMLDKYSATSIALAPSALSLIFKLSGDRLADYADRLDYIQLGSAAPKQEDKEKLVSLLPQCRLYNMYGSTEGGCACILNFNSNNDRPHCIGFPTKNSHFILTDENGVQLDASPDCTGFLSYGGTMCMDGYLDDRELTEKTYSNGYLRTSDMGKFDSDGRIYMLGRADDVINVGGNKVSPEEIEEAAAGFPGLTECACCGVADVTAGQVPYMFAVAGEGFDAAALIKKLTGMLESYKIPKRVIVVQELPRTYNGKLNRKVLCETFLGDTKGS